MGLRVAVAAAVLLEGAEWLSKEKQRNPNSGEAARVRVVFVFVHVRKTSVGMFILKLQYVQVFTYRMLTIKYYILPVMFMRHDTFCTTFSLFEQRFVPIKCQTSGKKRTKHIRIMVTFVCLKFAWLFCPVLVIFWSCGVLIVAKSFILHPFFLASCSSSLHCCACPLCHVSPMMTAEQGPVPLPSDRLYFESTWK